MMDLLRAPWPWYVAGGLIGLIVPALLILGNKHFGISANLRHACATCFPGDISFFQYDYKKEIWNLFFIVGIFLGGLMAATLLANPAPMNVHPNLVNELAGYGIQDYQHQLPKEIFSWKSLFTLRGFVMLVGGGFLVGFGSRYAGGCTSGHAIMGLSDLQWPSLVATMMFMIGGFIMANIILPLILSISI